jgi:GNAT superfamily N-acetyltransferase
MNIEIVPATAQDVPVILSLIRELAVYEKLLDEVNATEESLERDLFGPRPYAEVLLGKLDGNTVGYALFFHSYSTFLSKPGIYLEDVYVQPAARGFGVGKRLFLQVAKIAADRQCGRLEFAVLDWNAPSIAFYKALGAVPMGDWSTYRLNEGAIAAIAR